MPSIHYASRNGQVTGLITTWQDGFGNWHGELAIDKPVRLSTSGRNTLISAVRTRMQREITAREGNAIEYLGRAKSTPGYVDGTDLIESMRVDEVGERNRTADH